MPIRSGFPDLSVYVPYTGATGDVNLGVYDITATTATFSALTAGRNVYVGTAGLLSDDANNLWESVGQFQTLNGGSFINGKAAFQATGTVTYVNTSLVINGVGTQFTKEVKPGDYVWNKSTYATWALAYAAGAYARVVKSTTGAAALTDTQLCINTNSFQPAAPVVAVNLGVAPCLFNQLDQNGDPTVISGQNWSSYGAGLGGLYIDYILDMYPGGNVVLGNQKTLNFTGNGIVQSTVAGSSNRLRTTDGTSTYDIVIAPPGTEAVCNLFPAQVNYNAVLEGGWDGAGAAPYDFIIRGGVNGGQNNGGGPDLFIYGGQNRGTQTGHGRMAFYTGEALASTSTTLQTFYDRLRFNVGLNAGGEGAVFNEDARDYDFRFEGLSNANLLYLDASTNKVGVGTAIPTTELEVKQDPTSSTRGISTSIYTLSSGATWGNTALLYFKAARGTEAVPVKLENTDGVGSLYGLGYDGANFQYSGRIFFLVDAATSAGVVPQAIGFSTGTASYGTERMRITSTGFVGIGTSSPGTILDVRGNITILGGSDIRPTANSTTAINIAQADGTDFIIFDSTNKRMGIQGTPTAPMETFNPSADVTFGNYGVGWRLTKSGSSVNGMYMDINGTNGPSGAIIRNGATQAWLLGLNNGNSLRISPMASVNQTGITNSKDGASPGLTIDTNGNFAVDFGGYIRLGIGFRSTNWVGGTSGNPCFIINNGSDGNRWAFFDLSGVDAEIGNGASGSLNFVTSSSTRQKVLADGTFDFNDTSTQNLGAPITDSSAAPMNRFRSFSASANGWSGGTEYTVTFSDIGTDQYNVWAWVQDGNSLYTTTDLYSKTSSSFNIKFSGGTVGQYAVCNVIIMRYWNP